MTELEKNSRIASIEDFLSELLAKAKYKNGKRVFPNVFVGFLPPAFKKEWQTVVLIDLGAISQFGGFASCAATIFVFTKPTGDNLVKNSALMDKQEYAINRLVDDNENSDPRYSIQREWADQGYDEARQLHVNIINISVTIK